MLRSRKTFLLQMESGDIMTTANRAAAPTCRLICPAPAQACVGAIPHADQVGAERPPKSKTTRLYLLGAAAVLIFSAGAKLLSVGEDSKFMADTNSIVFFLSNRQTMTLAAVLELGVVWALIWPSERCLSIRAKFTVVAWLACLFALYRLGLLAAQNPRPCKCLGNSLAWIGLSERQIECLALAMLAYLLVPSLVWLFRERRRVGWARLRTQIQ